MDRATKVSIVAWVIIVASGILIPYLIIKFTT